MPDMAGTVFTDGVRVGNVTHWAFTTSTNTTNSDTVWASWVYNGTSSTTLSDHTWSTWIIGSPDAHYYRVPVETPEQRAAREQREAERRAQWQWQREKEQADRAEAEQKAKVILEENLTPEQRKQLRDNKWFEVITAKGRFRIRTGWSGNVDRVDDAGRPTDRYCIHPGEWVPQEDNMLAQKLLLEYDPEAFLRIANRSTPYGV